MMSPRKALLPDFLILNYQLFYDNLARVLLGSGESQEQPFLLLKGFSYLLTG